MELNMQIVLLIILIVFIYYRVKIRVWLKEDILLLVNMIFISLFFELNQFQLIHNEVIVDIFSTILVVSTSIMYMDKKNLKIAVVYILLSIPIILFTSYFSYYLIFSLLVFLIRPIGYTRYIDKQTCLLNREGIFELIKMKQRRNNTFSTVLLDIHNFKTINQKLGFSRGDQLLMSLSKELKENFSEAVIGKMSGDEFVLVSNETSTDEIEKIKKKISLILVSESKKMDFPMLIRFSFSFIIVGKNAKTVDELFKVLYQKLDVAKRNIV